MNLPRSQSGDAAAKSVVWWSTRSSSRFSNFKVALQSMPWIDMNTDELVPFMTSCFLIIGQFARTHGTVFIRYDLLCGAVDERDQAVRIPIYRVREKRHNVSTTRQHRDLWLRKHEFSSCFRSHMLLQIKACSLR